MIGTIKIRFFSNFRMLCPIALLLPVLSNLTKKGKIEKRKGLLCLHEPCAEQFRAYFSLFFTLNL